MMEAKKTKWRFRCDGVHKGSLGMKIYLCHVERICQSGSDRENLLLAGFGAAVLL